MLKNRRPLLHAARHQDISSCFVEGIFDFEVKKYLDVFLSYEGARIILGKKIDELVGRTEDIFNNNKIIDDWSFLALPKVYNVMVSEWKSSLLVMLMSSWWRRYMQE